MTLSIFAINIASCIVFVIFFLYIKRLILKKREKLVSDSQIYIIDKMDHHQFSEFIIKMYQASGYELNRQIDSDEIICFNKYNTIIGVNTVLSHESVGVKDIEKIIILIDKQIIDYGHIFTNRKFTYPAKEIVKNKKISLFDREALSKQIIDLGIYPVLPHLH